MTPHNKNIPSARHCWATAFVTLLLVGLASCGGVGSGGSGMSAGSVADGTVNGFGSVIVDGARYDDRNASVVSEVAPGSDVITQVRFGQRVSVQLDAAGVASTVRVDAALAGPVASIESTNQFSMLGQTVLVNTTGTAGPITQFGGGYSQASDLHARDVVSVHGLLVRQGTSYVFQATRIDKLAAMPAYLRATGIVGNLGSSTFTLGALTVDATGATLLPAGSTLANGQMVTLLAPPDSLQTPTHTTWRVTAAQLRVQSVRDTSVYYRISGSISQLNTLARTFTLDGVTVGYGAASVRPGGTALANGLYAVVQATAASDGTLAATSVTVRDAGSDTEAELSGNISAYDATSRRFVVRGVAVDAGSASLEECPTGGLANDLYVKVEGRVTSSGVVASSVHCEAEPSGATVQRHGVAGSVNPVARSFVLTTSGGPVSVQWSDRTYFEGTSVSDLPGRTVEVDGSFVNGVLVATKIEHDN